MLLGTRVWGTYGNISNAPLVGFKNCCCGQKEYQCGVGIWFFCNTHMLWLFGRKKTEWKNHWFWVFENFQNQKNHWVRVFHKKKKITESLKNRCGKCEGPAGGIDGLKNRSEKCEGPGLPGGGTNGCLKRKVFLKNQKHQPNIVEITHLSIMRWSLPWLRSVRTVGTEWEGNKPGKRKKKNLWTKDMTDVKTT